MSEQKFYTILFDDGYVCDVYEDLDAAIADGLLYTEPNHPPLAWSLEPPWGDGGPKSWEMLLAESIAAGRLIDCIHGKYIPRIPLEDMLCEKEELGADFERVLRDNLWDLYVTEKDAAMIARDEKAKLAIHGNPAFSLENVAKAVDDAISRRKFAALTISPDLSPASHQTSPQFGSAFLCERD